MRNFSQFKGAHGPSGPMVNTPMAIFEQIVPISRKR